MSPLIRNAAAVVAGIVTGSLVNMALIFAGPMLIPPPAGVDMTDMQSLAESMHLMGPQHFVLPFLAHALGTLSGAFITFLIAGRNAQMLTYGVGAFFLLGGIVASRSIPAPSWFVAADLLLAYLPMAWLAINLGVRFQSRVGSLEEDRD